MTDRYTLGIDLGGTNIKAGVFRVEDLGEVRATSIETGAADGFHAVFERITHLVPELIEAARLRPDQVLGVGLGVPGPMSHDKGVVYNAPNLPGWSNVELRDPLSAAIDFPVTLENDANAAAYGEFVRGAGAAVDTLALMTLGTGVGGGIVIDGQIWRGKFESAAEIGHMIVHPGGRECPCGQRGCLERYASASAVADRAREALEAGEQSCLRDLLGRRERITSRHVADAAAGDDPLAARVWRDACRYLALTSINLQHLLNPEMVVLTGGLVNAGPQLLDGVRREFDALKWSMARDFPEITISTLGDKAGLIGVAALAAHEFASK